MEMIGEEVENKKEQDTRDYWIDLVLEHGGSGMRARGVLDTIEGLGAEYYSDGTEWMFEALVNDIQDHIQDGWEEDPHFWENGQIVTPSFIKGTYWKMRYAIWMDW
tara:strand:- start:70 stop:387 length:318 start_codon:yes stop_codon:yes gene_type:complete